MSFTVEAERGAARIAATEADRALEILDNMGEAFALIDRDFRIVQLNRAAIELDPRPATELIGQSIWDLSPEVGTSELGTALREAMAYRTRATCDHQQTWPDGQTVWVECRIIPVDAGLAIFYQRHHRAKAG